MPVRLWFDNLPTRMKAIVISLCVLAVAALGVAAYIVVVPSGGNTCMKAATTVVDHEGPNGECVGITDGSFVFDPSLASVEDDIRQENKRVVANYPDNYVSVVLLLPVSSSGGSIMPMSSTLEEIRGAYSGQQYTNRHDVDGVSPYIQLLIGNNGFQANQWNPVVKIIEQAPRPGISMQ